MKMMMTDDALQAFERNMLSRVAHLVVSMYRRYNIFPGLYIKAIEIRVLLSRSICLHVDCRSHTTKRMTLTWGDWIRR